MLTGLIFLIAIVLVVIGAIGSLGGSFLGILTQEYSPEEMPQLRRPVIISLLNTDWVNALSVGIFRCSVDWPEFDPDQGAHFALSVQYFNFMMPITGK